MPGTTSTALPSFSHEQHHETDAAKQKGGGVPRISELLEPKSYLCNCGPCFNQALTDLCSELTQSLTVVSADFALAGHST